ncbi:MAG: ester cyclase [Anaerolineae bacterium]
MSTEANKAIVRRNFEEAWNKMNLAVVDELVAPDYIGHFASHPQPVSGIEACKQFMSGYFVAFPDAHFDIEDMVAEGDKVVARWTVRGTHQGNLAGIPPTGKPITVPGMWILRLANGKIAEQWGINDTLGLMQQIGVIPARN